MKKKKSCVIERSGFKQESPGLNPDCFVEIRLLSKKYFNMLSYMIRLKTLLKIETRDTG